MATKLQERPSTARLDAHDLSERAKRHLWMHFTRHGGFADRDVPVIVRGEGCYVYDAQGTRYLDALAALFCVNAGHGRAELGAAAAAQVAELDFFQAWSFAHPRSIELAERVANLAPGDLNRVFFTSGGSEAVESAIKLVRSYHRARGDQRRTKIIAREYAYHGTSLGALAATGIPAFRVDFEPLTPGGCHVPNTNAYRLAEGADPLHAADAIEERILFEGPETVAAVILEPVQNAGGCLTPPDGYFQRVREICDRHGVLLISDEVICAWGRLGEYFGAQRYGYAPDIVTTAKGLTSAYAPMGAVIATDRVIAPFLEGDAMFAHGFTFGGHPLCAAVALANLDVFEREDLCGHVRAKAPELRSTLERLYDVPMVGDVRGDGFFYAIELVSDQATRKGFSAEQRKRLVREILPAELSGRGLITRVDDRAGDPLVLLCPPLIADTEQFEEIESALRGALGAAATRLEATS